MYVGKGAWDDSFDWNFRARKPPNCGDCWAMRVWLPALVLTLVTLLLNLIRTYSLLAKVVVTAGRPPPPTNESGTLPPLVVDIAALAASSTVDRPRLDLARSMDDFVGFRWLFYGRDLLAPPIIVDEVSIGVWERSLATVACY